MITDASKILNSENVAKIAIGTVQFGQKYGISNTKGQTHEDDILKILDFASGKKITTIDTAPAYGDAEVALGQALQNFNTFQIVTKTCALSTLGENYSPTKAITKTFEESLSSLHVEHTFGLIVQLAEDLLGCNGDEVWKTLEALKAAGKTQKIGVSCYTATEIRAILKRYPIELLQIPFNVFDQSLLSGELLNELTHADVEIHARSIFLQGLLLMKPEDLPNGFERAKPPLKLFLETAQAANLTPLELSLRFVSAIDGISKIIIGITDLGELQEIVTAMNRSLPQNFNLSNLAIEDKTVKTPSLWPPDTPERWGFDFSTHKGGS